MEHRFQENRDVYLNIICKWAQLDVFDLFKALDSLKVSRGFSVVSWSIENGESSIRLIGKNRKDIGFMCRGLSPVDNTIACLISFIESENTGFMVKRFSYEDEEKFNRRIKLLSKKIK